MQPIPNFPFLGYKPLVVPGVADHVKNIIHRPVRAIAQKLFIKPAGPS
jgi:hypothetical protein